MISAVIKHRVPDKDRLIRMLISVDWGKQDVFTYKRLRSGSGKVTGGSTKMWYPWHCWRLDWAILAGADHWFMARVSRRLIELKRVPRGIMFEHAIRPISSQSALENNRVSILHGTKILTARIYIWIQTTLVCVDYLLLPDCVNLSRLIWVRIPYEIEFVDL